MKWTHDYPIKDLPDKVRESFIYQAAHMYKDLQQNRFRYELEDHPEASFTGHKKKIVNSRNPEWYSTLWQEYSFERDDRKFGHPTRNIKKTTGKIREKHKRDNKLYKMNSKIRRTKTLKTLKRIEQQKDGTYLGSRFWYDAVFRKAIKERLLNGYLDKEYGEIHPDIEVVRYFEPQRLEDKIDEEVFF